MNLLNQLLQIPKNFAAMGQAKILAMAGVAVVSFAIIIAGALYVNKPSYETLYVGLEPIDLNQISVALAESGIDFETGADGQSIMVRAGMTSKARLLLAERGLPNSANAGYELFDNVGSLGLTSFMQEVTRVRALEGEIARTIQQISGIAAARVHIVMPDIGNFRRGEQNPTASVMVRASSDAGRKAAASIRQLVASSVPGLDVEDVTILDSTGQLLAAGDETGGEASRSLGVVQSVQREIETNIDKALAPFLGMDNFRSSVTAQINTDSQQIQETIYDPESRVERSVRVTKEQQIRQLRSSRTFPRQHRKQAAAVLSPPTSRTRRKNRPTTRSTAGRWRRSRTALRSKSSRSPSLLTADALPRWSANPSIRPRSTPISPKCRRSSARQPASTANAATS